MIELLIFAAVHRPRLFQYVRIMPPLACRFVNDGYGYYVDDGYGVPGLFISLDWEVSYSQELKDSYDEFLREQARQDAPPKILYGGYVPPADEIPF